MAEVHPASPETAYLTKNNIVHPRSDNADVIAAEEDAARAELSRRLGVTVTDGSITTGS